MIRSTRYIRSSVSFHGVFDHPYIRVIEVVELIYKWVHLILD